MTSGFGVIILALVNNMLLLHRRLRYATLTWQIVTQYARDKRRRYTTPRVGVATPRALQQEETEKGKKKREKKGKISCPAPVQ